MTHGSILLAGAGGHARACIDVIELEGRFTIGGLIGVPGEVGRRVLDYPVLGTDGALEVLLAEHSCALVAIGQIKTPDLRIRVFRELERLGKVAPCIVSPRAHVSRHATIGDGSIVMHGAIVNAGATVGRNCIINSHALVEHDVIVGDHCHVSTSAAVNSGVRIGEGTFLGSNSSVRQMLTIGARCVIGMGQIVLHDCEPGTTMAQRGRAT